MYRERVPQAADNGQPTRAAEADGRLPKSIAQAIDRLLKARNYAEETGRSTWDFAVTIAELRRDGVSENDLRWLVYRNYVEHAREMTRECRERTFDRRVNLRLCNRTAFVITDTGVAFSREFLAGIAHCDTGAEVGVKFIDTKTQSARPRVAEESRRSSKSEILPKWDRNRRELRVDGQLVKVFKLPSPMQEAILMAFEEEHWPPRIDDPLPVHPDLLPKRRLHDTIKSLNRNQKSSLIRFMGDGTGEGIRWELTAAEDEAKHPISLLG